MNNQWTDNIRRRMHSYERPVPDALWQRIEQQMEKPAAPAADGKRSAFAGKHSAFAGKHSAFAGKHSTFAGKRSAFVRWGGAAVGVAAAVALVFLVARYEPSQTAPLAAGEGGAPIAGHTPPPAMGVAPDVSGRKPVAPDGTPSNFSSSSNNKSLASNSPARPVDPKNSALSSPTPTDSVAASVLVAAAQPEPSDTTKNAPQRNVRPNEQRNDPRPETLRYVAQDQRPASDTPRLAFALRASGGPAPTMSSRGVAYPAYVGSGAGSEDWDAFPDLAVDVINYGREVETRVKHRTPLRAAASVSYALTPRLALETGLAYTRLAADLHYGSDAAYVDGTQRVDYIGLPLSLRCDLFRFKGLCLYASAGAMVEKCIAARRENTYVLDDGTRQTVTDHLGARPWQWSLNVAAGVQYNLFPLVALFAEPSVGYYFNDRSALRTLYADRPFNFSLNLGLRFTVGR